LFFLTRGANYTRVAIDQVPNSFNHRHAGYLCTLVFWCRKSVCYAFCHTRALCFKS